MKSDNDGKDNTEKAGKFRDLGMAKTILAPVDKNVPQGTGGNSLKEAMKHLARMK